MSAYYNEIDPYAAEWLRNLIKAGHIAPGFVDERSIEDVTPNELMGYTQCHFFAGIGVWSHALRSAGWPDSRPVWTGSCPCQPFSAAGKGNGFADERHLWPAFNHLIAECRPPIVIGEQVAAKAVEPWIDLVHADLEALGYTFGAIAFPSAGIGAPHIRDRMYWVADSAVRGRQPFPNVKPTSLFNSKTFADEQVHQSGTNGASPGGLDNNNNKGLEGHRGGHQTESGRDGEIRPVAETSESGGLADADSDRCSAGQWDDQAAGHRDTTAAAGSNDRHQSAGPTNGFWGAADWLLCRDGKWRPVEPGTFPLAHGAASRVGRLRAYGNAINAKAAQAFIECVI
jgi:DNA (cytosine-5)-methyltransferase 1